MLVQCVSCKREASSNAEGRLPPWCPSCGGNLKPVQAAAPAAATSAAGSPVAIAAACAVAAPVSSPTHNGAANGAANRAANGTSFADAAAPPVLDRPTAQEKPALTNIDDLGPVQETYRGSGWRQLVCWLVALVCFGLAGCIGYGVLHQPNKSPYAGLGLMAFFGLGGFLAVYVALSIGEVSYLVFADALVQKRGKETKIVRWDQIRDIYQTVHPAWKLYRIHTRRGFDFELSSTTKNYLALADHIERKQVEQLLPGAMAELERGDTIRFGPLAVSRIALHFDNLSASWQQVSMSIGLNMEPIQGAVRSNLMHLHIHSAVQTRAYKVEMAKIPNFRLFIEVVRQVWPMSLPAGL